MSFDVFVVSLCCVLAFLSVASSVVVLVALCSTSPPAETRLTVYRRFS